jgi:hypothetical protein
MTLFKKIIPQILLLSFCLLMSLDAQAQFPKLFKKRKKENTEAQLKTEERWYYQIIENAAAPEGALVAQASYSETGEQTSLKIYQQSGALKYSYQYKKEELKRKRYWEQDGQQIKDYVEELDALGNVIKRIRYKPTGEILDITSWEYDSQGRPSLEVYYDDANKRVYEINYSYNDAQRSVTEKQHFLIEDEYYMTAVELDENFQPLSRSRYKKSGPLVDKVVYLRDEEGRLKEVQHYPDGKNMSIKEKYEYKDDRNKVVYSVFNVKTNKMLEYSVFVYKYYE